MELPNVLPVAVSLGYFILKGVAELNSRGIVPVIVNWTQKASSRIIVEPSPSLVFWAEGRIRFRCALHEPVDDQYFQPLGIVNATAVSTLSKLKPLESDCTKPKKINFSHVVEHHEGLPEGCYE